MDTPRKPGRWARLAIVGLAGVSMVGALGGTAFAQTESEDSQEAPAESDGPRRKPQLTDEQRACIEGQGVDLPDPPAEGEEPAERVRPTEEQRAAFKAAAEACGIELPRHHRGPKLTDEQKACLEQQGVQKPAKDENGERVRPTEEQRAAFEAAAEACGIDLPERPSGEEAPAEDAPAEDGTTTTTPDSNDANVDADAA